MKMVGKMGKFEKSHPSSQGAMHISAERDDRICFTKTCRDEYMSSYMQIA